MNGELHEAPGWAAISDAFDRLYEHQEPMHVAPTIGPAFGGAALQGVSAYLHPDGHWHYVGYGLSELYEKISPIADQSGWGFELTMRVAHASALPPRVWSGRDRPPPEASAPLWPVAVLQTIATFVQGSGQPIPAGALLAHRPPAAPWIGGLVAVPDRAFDVLSTPHGKLVLLQLVGLGRADYDRAQRSPDDLQAVLRERATASSLLVTPGA